MSVLGFSCSANNGLSFDLTVDGVAIWETLGSDDRGIPYWLFSGESQDLPALGPPADPGLRIVAVCECGEYGCSHTACHVRVTDDLVTLSAFDLGDSRALPVPDLHFSLTNYRAVVEDIVRRASEFEASLRK